MSTGNCVVDDIGKLNFDDVNVIPNSWYDSPLFRFEKDKRGRNGAINLAAILMLSEVIYWYRPSVIRDEISGKTTGYKKKFAADKLQKSYADLADKFGVSKQQAADACAFLKKRSLITIEYRTVKKTNSTTGHETILNNVVFIEPVVNKITEITFTPESTPSRSQNDILSFSDLDPSRSQNGTNTKTTNTQTTKEQTLFDSTPSSSAGNTVSPKEKQPETDNRLSEFVKIYSELYMKHNRCPRSEVPWGAKCAARMKKLLSQQPGWGVSFLHNCLKNRFRSEVNVADAPELWMFSKITSYRNGPLDKFGKPLQATNTSNSAEYEETEEDYAVLDRELAYLGHK